MVLGGTISGASAAGYTEDDTLQSLEGKPAMVWRIIYCESKFDPYAYNQRSGAAGAAQLLPGRSNGQGIFYSWGYTDPYDPDQAVSFVMDVYNGRGGITMRSQYAATMDGCPGSRW